MANLNLSSSCITYGGERSSERVQEFLQNSIVSKNQLSQFVSLSSFEEKVPAERIPQVIEELHQYEEYCVQSEQYFEAEKCVKKIEALQKQEVKFSEKAIKSLNKCEMSELEEINLQQFKDFNEIWDKSIEDYQKELKQKEEQLTIAHQVELANFDQNAKYIVFPKTKFSSEVLSLRNLLDQLNKNKRYVESHDVKKRILELECRDEEQWALMQEKKIAGQHVLLQQKQKAELHALQTKLEDQLQLKIRTRKSEMNKYAQWLQNMKQELSVTHGLEISRIIAKGEKRNSKVSGGLCNSSMLLSQNYSQLLDMSKSYATTIQQQTQVNNETPN